MAQTTIPWADYTFNPWWGCVEDGPECGRCYAKDDSERFKSVFGYESIWGPARTTERKTMGKQNWQEPHRWNRTAQQEGKRYRVFSGSMCDVGEDHPTANGERPRLVSLIEQTPELDWLLLTKRPQNLPSLFPWGKGPWPHNIWVGTSVGLQSSAEKRIPDLLDVDAIIRFLSIEPLLGPVHLEKWLATGKIHWVIVGGESDRTPKRPARPMKIEWVFAIKELCDRYHIQFHMKQFGSVWAREQGIGAQDRKGEKLLEYWPEELRVREIPIPQAE